MDGLSGTPPVTHSTFDPVALVPFLEAHYDLGGVTGCVLYRSYANDVYRLTMTRGARYYLKVYRRDWRSPSEVDWELRIQRHLMASGVSIARPIARCDGSLLSILVAPEGERAAVLFEQSRGRNPERPFTTDLYEVFGRAAAGLHAALDTMPDPSGRPPDEIETLLLAPGRILRTVCDPAGRDRHMVDAVVQRLAEEVDRRSPALDWGVCHGDLTLDNITVTEDGGITFYDFDLAAPSWRARDPCGVYAYSRQVPHARDFWDAFLLGYRQVRSFSADNEYAVPLMHAVSQFWDLGHEVSRWSRWSGQWRVSPEIVTARLGDIQSWIDAELD